MNMHVPTIRKAGPFTRFMLRFVGVDEETLATCPAHDWESIRALATIMACTMIYQTALFSLIAHICFAAPGQFRPELVLAAFFAAAFIQQIDSYMFFRAGFHSEGIKELKRGGIDISGGPFARIGAGFSLLVRLMLSIGLAQITAVCLGLALFSADIHERIQDKSLQANAPLIRSATSLVDGDIKRATDAVTAETARQAALVRQVATLQQEQIDPAASNVEVQEAQQELTQTRAAKAKADDDLKAAEDFSASELGGLKHSADNSGHAGDGPRHAAALEQVKYAKAHAADAAKAANSARNRLDALRSHLASTDETTKQEAHDRLPAFEAALAAQNTRLLSLKRELASLIKGRDDAIRTAIEHAPDHVNVSTGLLAQAAAIDQITRENPKIAALVLLSGLVSFGFELASVLAKIMSYVPTTYSALLARNAYMAVVRIVDNMIAELNWGPVTEGEIAGASSFNAANENQFDASAPPGTNPFERPDDPPQPPKRGRGRPRKNRLN